MISRAEPVAGKLVEDFGGRTPGPKGLASPALLLMMIIAISSATNMDRAIMALALQPIKVAFHLNDTWIGLISGGPFAIVYSLTSLPLARVADRGNRKRVLLLCFLLWIAMMLGCGMAVSIAWLLVARMGVGMGEAGVVPPSHAIIADAYPPQKRAGAFFAYSLSTVLSAPIAYAGGGWVLSIFGWKALFIAAAILSVPVALLGVFFIFEPKRDALTVSTGVTEPVKLSPKDVRTLALIAAGCACYATYSYGPLGFLPTFLMRYTVTSISTIGVMLGVTMTAASILGAILGAVIGNRLVTRGPAWHLYLPAGGLILCVPVTIATFATNDFMTVTVGMGVVSAILFASFPAIYAAIQHVAGEGNRTTVVAIVLAIMNLIGMTLGPFLTGMLSDAAARTHGSDGLRISMLLVSLILLPGGTFFALAARRVGDDRTSS